MRSDFESDHFPSCWRSAKSHTRERLVNLVFDRVRAIRQSPRAKQKENLEQTWVKHLRSKTYNLLYNRESHL